MPCETCHETGWLIEKKDGVEFAQRCPECSIEKGSQRSLDYAHIPPRYQSKGFEVYEEYHPSQRRAVRRAIDYVEGYPNNEKGLLLTGNCGVGKTHLAVAMLKSIISEKSTTGRFVDETEFLRRLHFSYGPEAVGTESQVILPLMNVDLLVWDDLGTSRPTDWAQETIRMVLNHRYTYQKNTILTTNLNLKRKPVNGSRNSEQTLEERIGTRLLSRLLEMCELVEIKGPDAREKQFDSSKEKNPNEMLHRSGADIPAGLIHCPNCSENEIEIQDNRIKGKGLARLIEASCFCRECSSYFIARYYSKTESLEYPE